MNEKRFNVMKSTFVENGWFISDKFRKFTFLTTEDKKSLFAYCRVLNKLENELILWKTSASEEEKHDLITEIISLREENQHLQQDLADSETKNAYITGIILIAITIILLLLIY